MILLKIAAGLVIACVGIGMLLGSGWGCALGLTLCVFAGLFVGHLMENT